MMIQDYSAKSAAVRAAKAHLGPEAKLGIDFDVAPLGQRWLWSVKATASAQMPSGIAAAGLAEAMGGPLAEEAPAADRAKAASPEPEKKARRNPKYEAALEAAQKGILPEPPNFEAETHRPYRKRLAELVEMAKAGDLAGLRAAKINPISTSPKAMDRFRNLAVVALEARA